MLPARGALPGGATRKSTYFQRVRASKVELTRGLESRSSINAFESRALRGTSELDRGRKGSLFKVLQGDRVERRKSCVNFLPACQPSRAGDTTDFQGGQSRQNSIKKCGVLDMLPPCGPLPINPEGPERRTVSGGRGSIAGEPIAKPAHASTPSSIARFPHGQLDHFADEQSH